VGNSSDQLLYFLSELRTHLNLARKEGRLDHDVRMVGCAYEGTCTLEGPQHPIPQNLIDAGDYLIYAPIIRCYAHDFGDANCSWNAGYTQTLGSWLKHSPSVGMMIDEYYNVSKFEDLPILFTNRITADLPFYHAMGVRGMTYMHVPMTNWAMRSLTQILYAELCWNIHADVHSILKAYFHLQYGPYSETMRRVYALLEEAWLTSAQWRAWRKSILNDLLVWDGAKPVKPFLPNDHFSDTQDIINNGRRSISLMQEAMKLLNDARKIEQTTAAMQADLVAAQAVNPVQAREHEKAARYENRLGEDRRLMTYGLDTLTIMTELVCYYEALRVDDQTQAEIHWGAIESVAEKLDGYFVPMTFDWPGPGFECRDGLTRSQVREVLRRCRKYRLMINGKS
jgi:hypothetical protein